jgi:hypothetical protein
MGTTKYEQSPMGRTCHEHSAMGRTHYEHSAMGQIFRKYSVLETAIHGSSWKYAGKIITNNKYTE